jgi:hypothetical protein
MEMDATVAFTGSGGAKLCPTLFSLVNDQVILSRVIDDFALMPPRVLPQWTQTRSGLR